MEIYKYPFIGILYPAIRLTTFITRHTGARFVQLPSFYYNKISNMFWDKFWQTVQLLSFCFLFFFCKLLNYFLYPHTTHLHCCHVSSLTFSYRHPLTTDFPCQKPGEALLALSSVQVTGCVPDRAHANKIHE